MNKSLFFRIGMVSFGLMFGAINSWAQKKTNTNKVVQVVLLGGQSNMGGHGDYDNLDDATKERIIKVQSRVKLSTNAEPAKPLSYYTSKSDQKFSFTKSFGPELLMGVTLAEKNPDKKYLLIKTSHGGTALYGAWNPEWTADKAKAVESGTFKQNLKLYQLSLENIKNNLNQLKEEGDPYKIIGMAWMQGENDAAKKVSALSYEENLKKLIAAYRTDLNIKNMPFVIGQINSRYGDFPGGPQVVRQAMENVAEADDHVGIIKTSTAPSWSDYPKHTDNVHYNSEGQKRLGTAFGNELLKLCK